MGNSRTALFCCMDDPDIKSNAPKSLEGKTIGVYEYATEDIRRLKEFLQIHNIHCTLRTFTNG